MSREVYQHYPLKVLGARLYLRDEARVHKKFIDEAIRGELQPLEEGTTIFRLPTHGHDRKISLVVDNGKGSPPSRHDEFGDMCYGLEADDKMVYTVGGVLMRERPLIIKGKKVKDEYVGMGIREKDGSSKIKK